MPLPCKFFLISFDSCLMDYIWSRGSLIELLFEVICSRVATARFQSSGRYSRSKGHPTRKACRLILLFILPQQFRFKVFSAFPKLKF